MNPHADGYRLPTEAEWELAWHCGGRAKGVPEPDGWHNQISDGNTHPVRTMPSATGKSIHDMLGNVAEWCWDWKGPLVPFSHVTDPRGPDSRSPPGFPRRLMGRPSRLLPADLPRRLQPRHPAELFHRLPPGPQRAAASQRKTSR